MKLFSSSQNGWSKRALILLGTMAFLSVFATIDTSEHFRTWRTARMWTDEQKVTARAEDASAMFAIASASVIFNTVIVACSAVGALALGISVALDNKKWLSVSWAIGLCASVCGILYSLTIILYKIRIGGRHVLKGPIFDYSLALQLPIVLAVAGYILVFILWIALMRSARASRAGQGSQQTAQTFK